MANIFSPSLLLQTEEVEPGKYVVKQLETPSPITHVANDGDRIPIDFDIKIIHISGYIDPKAGEIAILPTVLGITGNTYYASLSKGIEISFELIAGRATIALTVNGKDLGGRIAFAGRLFVPSFDERVHILTLP